METFTLWLALLCAFVLSCLLISRLRSHSVEFPESIPVVGLREEVFKTTRASFRQLTDGIRTLSEGYHQVPSTQHSMQQPPKLRSVLVVFQTWPTVSRSRTELPKRIDAPARTYQMVLQSIRLYAVKRRNTKGATCHKISGHRRRVRLDSVLLGQDHR